MYLKLTANQKIEISNIDGEKIKELLLEVEPPKFIEVNGQTIKTANIIGVFNEEGQNVPAYMEFSWSDEELLRWEKEIFGENWKQGELIRDTFKDYLIDVGAWTVSERYPNGAVKDPKKYRELTAKWSALGNVRYKREKLSGFVGRNKQIQTIKDRIKGVVDKMGVEPIQEEPISHDIGCEIQHTGDCNCKDENYEPNPDDELSEDDKKIIQDIPF